MALVAIAGCSGAAAPLGAPVAPAGQTASAVHPGVPFVPSLQRIESPEKSVSPAYSTRKSLVFVSDQIESAVNVYQTAKLKQNPAPIATIHAAHGCPYNLAMNKHGTLFVADNCGGNDVEEYAKGKTTMKTSITTGISNPLGVAIDAAGTLYVSNYPASITVYPAGSTSPSKTITGGGMMNPFGLTVDLAGNVYIADFGAKGVFELPAGGSSVTNLALVGLQAPIGVAVDNIQGLLWVTDESGNTINVYQLGGSKNPVKTLPGNGSPYAISLQNRGRPRLEVVESDVSTDAVYAYKLHDTVPYATLTNGIQLPTGLLIAKP